MADLSRLPVPILLTVRKLDGGGIERDVAKLAIGLDRMRFTPHVAVFQGGGLRSPDVQKAGVPILDLDVSSYKSPRIVWSAARFARFVLEKKIRVVHAYDVTAGFAVPVARLLRVPLVLSSAVGHRDLFDPRTRQQMVFTDRLVDGVVVNCVAMRQHLMEDYGFPLERTLLCYNGVNTAEFSAAARDRLSLVADASLVIGSVCVLRPEKRMDMLIEAFAPLHKLQPGLKLLIVGSGPELPKLQQKAAALELGTACVFVPAQSAVAPFLRSMDIFVSCSSSEAFSNAILEAMACGCCPVGSRVGGTPELIEDHVRGLLFETGNVNELSEKLATLILQPNLRASLASNAARFAAEELNMQVALDRMSQIYQEGLARKNYRTPSELS